MTKKKSKTHQTPKALATKKNIFDTSIALFQSKGFEETTMRDIAKASDLSSGSAYYYFSSKEEIILELYQQIQIQSEQNLLQHVDSKKSFHQNWLVYLSNKLAFIQPYRSFWIPLFRKAMDPKDSISPFHPTSEKIRKNEYQILQKIFEGSKPDGIDIPFEPFLPWLWLMQLLVALFWLYDTSENQAKTALLMNKVSESMEQFLPLLQIPMFLPMFQPMLETITLLDLESYIDSMSQ